MADDAGVMDMGLDLDLGSETTTTDASAATAEPPAQADPPEDADKSGKAYRDWVKAQRDANKNNPEALKHVKYAYDAHGRLTALNQLDPKGIDGVRETYALIQAAGGPEKITEMQQFSAERQQQDALWQAGDPKALENIPPEWDKGLAKLAPQYLDRIQKADPEAYANAMLPHLVQNLLGSPLVAKLNEMIDVLGPESGLDEKGKVAKIAAALGQIGGWFDKQQQRAGQLKQAPAVDPKQSEFEAQRSQFEKERQAHFFATQVTPATNEHAAKIVTAELAPYLSRLQLNDAAKKVLYKDFQSGMADAQKADKAYNDQLQLLRNAKQPNAEQIKQHVNNFITKNLPRVIKDTVEARYGFAIKGKPGPKPGTPGATTAATGGAGTRTNPIAVPTKPPGDKIDWPGTKREGDMYKFIYKMKDGKFQRWNRG